MGSNMQRQAVPLIRPEAPLVGTGIERNVARDSGQVILAEANGVIKEVDAAHINVSVWSWQQKRRDKIMNCRHL